MPHLDETDLVLAFAERLHDAVDAVSGKPEDHVDSPSLNCVEQNIGCVH